VSELVVDGETGQVVFPSDPDGLAEAIARYLDDADFCRNISVAGRPKVEQVFNIEDQVDTLASLFRESAMEQTS